MSLISSLHIPNLFLDLRKLLDALANVELLLAELSQGHLKIDTCILSTVSIEPFENRYSMENGEPSPIGGNTSPGLKVRIF